jgi:hypothetical protein
MKCFVQLAYILHDHVEFYLGNEILVFFNDLELLVNGFKQDLQLAGDDMFVHKQGSMTLNPGMLLFR